MHKTVRLKRRNGCVEPYGSGRQDVTQLFEALRYKLVLRGFYSWWGHCNFYLINYPYGLNTALGSAQTLTETSTRNISWG